MFLKQNLMKLCLLLICIPLAACRVELYSELPEKEGNEILSILLEHNIDGHKVTDFKKKTNTVYVEESQLSEAIQILSKYGLPRDTYSSVGDVFKKDGMISSPLEERARYIYALSQEVSETLSQLDGVITARVHIVIPEPNPRLQIIDMPSSASVFIKHNDLVQLDVLKPQIKLLVSNSIEGLDYENVSVVLFPAYSKSIDLKVQQNLQWQFWMMISGGVLFLLITAGVGFFMWKRKNQRPVDNADIDMGAANLAAMYK